MAIRKSKAETFQVKGEPEGWLSKCERALKLGGFKSISVNDKLSLVTAKISNFTLSGSIKISLMAMQNDRTEISVESTANIDNIYALFRSPNSKILETFRNHL